MQTVTVTRNLDADAATVRAAMTDIEPFMRAGEFDGVTVDGDTIHLTNHVGLATIELTLDIIDDPDAVVAYEQREGIFSEMSTRYFLTEHADGVEVRATTEYAVKTSLVGPILDATVVKRQRRAELNAQFDYLVSL